MKRISFQTERSQAPSHKIMEQICGAHSFGCNDRYLEKDGKPWLPVMAEFHFTRYSCEDWETELRKIKACGVDIVSSYLFWVFHEEMEGTFNFCGDRDIGRFLQICKEVGLYAFVRIGPWCHGECRNGGFPDWVQQSGLPLRGCDPRYLALVRKLYEAYAEKIKPWLFQNDGPVIGIQLENELTENAPYLAELKKMAVACGLIVPYYTVTGWGAHIADFPRGEVLPVFGAYPAAPWEQHCEPLPPNENYFFTPLRNDPVIGSDQISGRAYKEEDVLQGLPFLTCELGPGVQCTYHRRPVISAMDVAALSWTKLGSGNNLPGYYVFHGGFNPTGGLYQESKASGYPNDLPVSSYDFQAPLGEYGQVRPSYFLLKRLHQFVRCCGEKLAAMETFFPDEMPIGRQDMETPRLALRSDGDGGYLFFNTHQRNHHPAPIQNLEVVIRNDTAQESCYGPLRIPSGICGVFTLGQTWFGVTVEYMTLQPLWVGILDGQQTLVCSALEQVAPELILRGNWNIVCRTAERIVQEQNVTQVQGLKPGRDCVVDIAGENANLRILVLEEADGLRFYPVQKNGTAFAVLSDGIVFEENEKLAVYGKPGARLWTYPCLKDTGACEKSGIFSEYRLPATPFSQLRKATEIQVEYEEKQKITKENPYAPYLFSPPGICPEYRLKIPADLLDGPYDALLRFNIQADVVQLYADQLLIADDFIRGEPWSISLRRIRPYLAEHRELRLKCSPLAPQTEVYLERPVARGQVQLECMDVAIVSVDHLECS